MNESRGSLYLLTGLILGLVLGLLYGWLWRPVGDQARPESLSGPAKYRYRVLIAYAYRATGSLPRARARLALLKDPDPYAALAEQARLALQTGRPPDEAQALGDLAVALAQGQGLSAATPTVGSLPPGDPTLPATETAAPTPGAGQGGTDIPIAANILATFPPAAGSPFVLSGRDRLCDPVRPAPLLQVQALDAAGNPQAGVPARVSWDGGQETFYTGLQPELGAGYADFSMQPGITYTLRLGEGGQPVGGLASPDCPESGGWGAWLLTFQQP